MRVRKKKGARYPQCAMPQCAMLELQDEEEYTCTQLKFNFGTLLLRISFLRRSHPWTGDN
jgi:hypothetical protein